MSRDSKSTATGLALGPTKRGLGRWIAHPWAILFSLVIAFLVLTLIDREIQDVIVKDDLRVVARPTDRIDEIVVILPAGFVMLEERAAPVVTHIEVKGPRRERGRITPPFQAWLPAERLVNLVQDAPERVSLEAKDLRIPGLSSFAAELRPLSILVAREGTLEMNIEAQLSGAVPEGYRAEITLSPSRVFVTGPQFELARRSKVSVVVTAPPLGQEGQEFIRELSLEDRQLGMRVVPTLDLKARVVWVPLDSEPYESSVRVVVARGLDTPFEYQLEPPYALERTPSLRFLGPKVAVERMAEVETRQRFETRVALILDAERTAISRQDLLADGAWHTLEVPGYIPENLIREFGLVQGPTILPVPVKVRKKPSR